MSGMAVVRVVLAGLVVTGCGLGCGGPPAVRSGHDGGGGRGTGGAAGADGGATADGGPPDSAGATVNVLWKPFDSETDWTTLAAAPDGTFVATVTGGGAGALFALELRTNDGAWRLPDVLAGTPYVSLSP